MNKKLIKWTVIVFMFGVIIYHVFWFYNYSMYNKYTEGLNELRKFTTFSILENDTVYHVKFPSYPTFTGNLAVATGDGEYSLIIWPSRYTDTEYGARITMDNDTYVSIMINRNLETDIEKNQLLIDEHRDKIEELFQKATARWGTLFE